MQYVGRAIGSVSKTWNSINPATLSGAIDVIVVEQADGELSCSPFHVRFGKFSLLRPSQKKVELSVNGQKTDLPMKLGEGGEAFFVFETDGKVPKELLTSPVVSPTSSPAESPDTPSALSDNLQEPDFLDLSRSRSSSPTRELGAVNSYDLDGKPNTWSSSSPSLVRSSSPNPKDFLTLEKVRQLTRKLTDVNIPSKVTDNGDIVLDMTGYKSGAKEFQQSEELVKKILAEEFGTDDPELESMLGPDEEGNLRIFSRDDTAITGYQSDSSTHNETPSSPELTETDSSTPYHAKTLRLTSDQLKSLNLHAGVNEMRFSVNQGRAVCEARMFYWKSTSPIVISDIDGTITKSDALGHVLTMLGRDWTHEGVGKLFTDIANNGYNVMYLTARSVGQADSTRYYLRGIEQNGYKLPDGPVILSPDRTIAALRREVIMRKPEVFKMACLRDIQGLFGNNDGTPFYAGFGNRITDALSYRSVGVPSSKIFTINSNSEVHMELLELAGYKSSYVHIADLVDHFFPPIMDSVQGQESYTDVNFWREPIPDVSDLESLSDDESRGRSPPSSPKPASTNSLPQDEEDQDYEYDDDDDEDYDDEDEEDYDDEEEYDYEDFDDEQDNSLPHDPQLRHSRSLPIESS
ncbi:hypothetical protein TRICI_002213 [Trichomonascus ciferrii]|uniref:LNS2/PITP domain-containing protein n=1 Tax=Trichomonascus ciferrii TaxID=44093 RepID=A0A642V8P1_9ASCO|nr:hypothetical protein TRICI_002213 [Trichomonascus ciferrii]